MPGMTREILWGVKRKDGTMIQCAPKMAKLRAIYEAAKVEPELTVIAAGVGAVGLREATRKAGYEIVRAAVVELLEMRGEDAGEGGALVDYLDETGPLDGPVKLATSSR